MTDELTALSEEVEKQIVRDLMARAPKDLAEEIGYKVDAVGGTLISRAAGDGSIIINRTLGLDDTGHDPALIDRALKAYDDAGVAKFFLHVQPDAPDSLRDDLLGRGLKTGRAWMKFKRGMAPVDLPENDLRVEELTPASAADFGRITATCFGMTPTFGKILAATAIASPNWHVFMAFDGDAPAGCGCLVTYENVGLLDMGATDPDFRCRGVQGAVMAARINKAVDLGLGHLFTETGEAVEGEAQHSYGNILRYGFEEWYARQNYLPDQG